MPTISNSRLGARHAAEVSADRILVAEKLARERLTDDGDLRDDAVSRRRCRVLDDRGANDVEVRRRHAIPGGRVVVSRPGRSDGHRPRRRSPSPRPSGEYRDRARRKRRQECRRSNRGCACRASKVAPAGSPPASDSSSPRGGRSCSNPKRLFLEMLQRARQQPRRRQEHQRQRRLKHDECLPCGSEPARAVERLDPRSASIGSTRAAIQAGTIPKARPVVHDVTQAQTAAPA